MVPSVMIFVLYGVIRAPPRRLPEPVLALKGATSYWAFVVASLPGHRSNAGAQGTSARMVAPDRSVRTASLHRHLTAPHSDTGARLDWRLCRLAFSRAVGLAFGRRQ